MRVAYREEPCRTALNRVGNMPFKWSLNPYMGCAHRCTFCYVRGFERRAERPSGEAYGQSVRVKINIAEVLRAELARRSWRREVVAIGAATDPYQPVEGRYRLTRACLHAFAEARSPFSLITRGPLVVRDLDVLQQAAQRAEVDVTFSVPTLDADIWRRTEPGTAPPRQRIRALKALVDAGIRAGVGMAPLLPGLSDDPKKMSDVIRAVRDAGAAFVWAGALYLKPGTREHFLEHLAQDWPELVAHYESLYANRAYLAKADSGAITERFTAIRSAAGSPGPHPRWIAPPPEPKQLQLI
jgi:DNA repair photolyase